MATIIWCDRVKHVVSESREQVAELIGTLLDESASPANYSPPGFGYFTDVKTGRQRALNVRLISSFEPRGLDGI